MPRKTSEERFRVQQRGETAWVVYDSATPSDGLWKVVSTYKTKDLAALNAKTLNANAAAEDADG